MSSKTNGTAPGTLKAARTLAAVLGSGYTPLPRKVRRSRLSSSAKIVYNSLCSFFQLSEQREEECLWPTQEKLAADTSEHITTVRRALKELLACRLIMRQRRGQGKGDLYWLTDEEEWVLPTEDEEPRPRKMRGQDDAECAVQAARSAASEPRKVVVLEAAECAAQTEQNAAFLYKKQQRTNNEPSKNEEEQPTHIRAADAAGGAQEGAALPGATDRPGGAQGQGAGAVQLAFGVGGDAGAPPDATPPLSPTSRTRDSASGPAPAAEGPKDKGARGVRKDYERLSVAHEEGEDPEDYAAREYLTRVRGWGECAVPSYLTWRRALAPLVATAGPEGFSDWITWLLSDPWFKENAYKLQQARLLQEFEDWWNLPAPRPLRRKSWAPKRDDGRVENNQSQVQEVHRCAACGGHLGEVHHESCVLVKRGLARPATRITQQQCDKKWAITALNNLRRQSAG